MQGNLLFRFVQERLLVEVKIWLVRWSDEACIKLSS